MNIKEEEKVRANFRKSKKLLGDVIFFPREDDHVNFWKDWEKSNEKKQINKNFLNKKQENPKNCNKNK